MQSLSLGLAQEQQSLDAVEKRIGKHASEVAKQVKEQLRVLPAYANYNRTKVEELWKAMGFRGQATSLSELALLQRRANEGPGIRQPTIEVVAEARHFAARLESLKPPTQTDSISGEHRTWIVEGIKLHAASGGEQCLYCTNGISLERQKRLRSILDDDATKFQALVRDLLGRCAAVEAAFAAMRLADSAVIREAARPAFNDSKADLEKANAHVLRVLEAVRSGLLQSLESRRVELPDLGAALANCAQAVASCNRALADHNRIVDQHHKEASTVADGFVRGVAGNALLDLTQDLEDRSASAKRLQKIQHELDLAKRAARHLEDSRVTPEISAQDLTRDLAAYFGRQEFVVQQNPDDPRFYQLLRNGEPVLRLSDGERRAISFVYFLETLRAHDFRRESGLVVIDDPVNSMDEQAVYHAQHFMRERCRGIAQVIVLTHNFPFFRLLKRDALNRMADESSLLMVSAGGTPRASTLANLDPFLREFESDYHFLFHQIWKVAKKADAVPGDASRMAEFMHIPNQARRVLEAFGAFVFPAQGGVSAAGTLDMMVDSLGENAKHHVKEAAKSAGAIKALLNHGSHQTAIGGHDPDPAVILDCPTHMKSLLALMKHSSFGHIDGMESACRRREGGT